MDDASAPDQHEHARRDLRQLLRHEEVPAPREPCVQPDAKDADRPRMRRSCRAGPSWVARVRARSAWSHASSRSPRAASAIGQVDSERRLGTRERAIELVERVGQDLDRVRVAEAGEGWPRQRARRTVQGNVRPLVVVRVAIREKRCRPVEGAEAVGSTAVGSKVSP